ncbi:hypothetical protein OH77DRAFT_1021385 [Trametes cingulata]|nr:hypothetical protein OH77DRAFT_1021385 [Trametes cingulata]
MSTRLVACRTRAPRTQTWGGGFVPARAFCGNSPSHEAYPAPDHSLPHLDGPPCTLAHICHAMMRRRSPCLWGSSLDVGRATAMYSAATPIALVSGSTYRPHPRSCRRGARSGLHGSGNRVDSGYYSQQMEIEALGQRGTRFCCRALPLQSSSDRARSLSSSLSTPRISRTAL